jgi:hypothetical protein
LDAICSVEFAIFHVRIVLIISVLFLLLSFANAGTVQFSIRLTAVNICGRKFAAVRLYGSSIPSSMLSVACWSPDQM